MRPATAPAARKPLQQHQHQHQQQLPAGIDIFAELRTPATLNWTEKLMRERRLDSQAAEESLPLATYLRLKRAVQPMQ